MATGRKIHSETTAVLWGGTCEKCGGPVRAQSSDRGGGRRMRADGVKGKEGQKKSPTAGIVLKVDVPVTGGRLGRVERGVDRGASGWGGKIGNRCKGGGAFTSGAPANVMGKG